MATPAPNQRPPVNPSSATSGPSVSSSRWARSGEPGAAFSGLSRGGGRSRGNGRGRGGRGGRGGAPAREIKPTGDSTGNKVESAPIKVASTPSATPKSTPVAVSTQEKSPVSSNSTPSRPKGPSRRPSRTVPAVIVAQPSPSGDTPTSSGSRPQHRRRKSQSGKPLASTLAKIKPPAHDDNLLRPNRARLDPVPHSAPVKDTPPHLKNSFDMKNNIDALVERVRAVAMADNRPSTPGSHIDWAGDEDDSLPDLDDWGVTSVTGTGGKTQTISPIIVDGLKALPDAVIKPSSLSPSEKEELALSPVVEPLTQLGPEKSPLVDGKLLLTQNHHNPQVLPVVAPNNNTHSIHPSAVDPAAPVEHISPVKVALHPSLPPKPSVKETPTPPKFRHATAMRNPSPPKSRPNPATTPISPPAVKVSEELDTFEQAAETTSVGLGLAQSIHAPSASLDDSLPSTKPREGLTASIHAPQNVQQPAADLASNGLTSAEPRTHNLTHTRAQTVGRPFQDFRDSARSSRSGYSTPRGGLSARAGGHHARTHSSPPAGAVSNNQRVSHARPVITGDAISRLARTIGSTTVPPARVGAPITAHD